MNLTAFFAVVACGLLLPHCMPDAALLAAPDADKVLADVEDNLLQPLANERAAALNKISFAQFYALLAAGTNDAPFAFAGHTLSDVHATLLAAAPDFLRLDQKYSSLGSFLAATTAFQDSTS